ncbi:MAG: heme-binding protein [Gammaproteobacteria bacterium]|nr:heme-binding protein [Gammaproteobacteria bacterium]
MTTLKLLTPLLAIALLAAGFLRPALATEEPAFRLVTKDGAFELREYPALLAAETVVTDTDFEDAGNIAFNRLFGYISGNNRSRTEIAMTAPVVQQATAGSEKIAMTVPVVQQPGEAGSYRVAFLVPSGYTADTVPAPLDPAVRIVATPARRVAVRRYSGWATAAKHRTEEAELRAELEARGLTPAGDAISAQYNAPFVPGPFRRNEVLIPVK